MICSQGVDQLIKAGYFESALIFGARSLENEAWLNRLDLILIATLTLRIY
jgi:hypothetical protein